MKKIVLVCVLMLFSFSFAAVDYDQLKKDRDYCYKIRTSACSLKLINKYPLATRQWKNILKYDYGVNLLAEENYTEARNAFKEVLFYEKNNKQLIEMSQKKVNEIDTKLNTIAQANTQDYGNYFNKNETNMKWRNPENIKVFIASKKGKEYVFKKAFTIWDEKLGSLINFTYVPKEENANIVIKFVDSLSDNKAGLTRFNTVYSSNGVNYMDRVTVEIAMPNPYGGTYTDTNLLSIALHEIEHALGIPYHSDSKNDILYYSSESYKNGSISKRDINTIKQLYRASK